MSNSHRHHGCGGRGRCQNETNCDNGSSNNNRCGQLGPFVAIDPTCAGTPAPRSFGSMIPFSSGTVPAVMTTLLSGALGLNSAIGFGSSVPNIVISALDTIDLGIIPSEAFTVPRAGNITALSATFVSTIAVAALTGTTTIRAQIYRAPQGSLTFTATGAFVDLAPALPAGIAVGSLSAGNGTFAPVPVAVGDRLLMVFSATTTVFVVAIVTGNASAGITIE